MSACASIVAHAKGDVFEAVLRAWSEGVCVAMLSPSDAQASMRRVAQCVCADVSMLDSCTTHQRAASLELPASAACLFETSGSTSGAPKLARVSARALLASARAANERIPFSASDAWLVPLSLHHVGGFGAFLRAYVAQGHAGSPTNASADLAHSLCAQPEITHLSLVPTQLHRLLARAEASDAGALRHRIASLKAVLLGGAPSAERLRARALALGMPLFVTYGMTESASQAATSRAEHGRASTDAGAPLEGTRITISPQGEIMLGGATMFDGYIHGGVVDSTSIVDGMFATGDRGSLDSEGRLHVDGRIGLAFKSGGEFVQPERVERALLNLAGVTNAVVVGARDEEWGTAAVAFVDASADVPLDGLRALLATQLARHEIPRVVLPWPAEFRDVLKPSRAAMQALAESQWAH